MLVPDVMDLPLIYLIRQFRVRSTSWLCMLCTCMAAGTLPDPLRSSERLVWYSMLRASAWLFDTLIPEYTDQSPVVISASLVLDVTCGNFHCSWVSR